MDVLEALRGRRTRMVTRQLVACLQAGPWAWPDPELHPEERRVAEELAGTPPERPGEALLVTAATSNGSVWRYASGAPGGSALFDTTAQEARDVAQELLSQSASVIWLPPPRSLSAAAERLASCLLETSGACPPTPTVDGDSIGLSVTLAAVSAATQTPLAADLAASAVVKSCGGVRKVGLIEQKLRVIAAAAPGVRRVLVHEENVREAERAIAKHGLHLRAVKVSSVAQAVELALGEAPVQAYDDAGTDAARRPELVAALYDFALAPWRDALLTWGPVEKAAGRGLKWKELDREATQRLRLARAVAIRHDGSLLPHELPDDDWVRGLDIDERHLVLAHFTQHRLDLDLPDRVRLERLLASRVSDGSHNYARLRGARGRLAANRGDVDEALRLQRAALKTFRLAHSHTDPNFQLSELFRLAAVFRRRDVYDDTLRDARLIKRQQPSPYVQIQQGRAEVALGLPGGEARLRAVAEAKNHPAHVRASANCWLFRSEGTGLVAGNAAFDRLKQDFVDQDDNIERYRLLWRIHVGDDAEVLASWKELRKVQGRRCDVVLRGRDEDDPAVLREVAWAWPY